MSIFHTQTASLSAEKQALFELLLKKKGIVAPQAQSTIPKRPEASAVPLSAPMKRIWSLHQLAPDSPAYNMTLARHLTGPLDVDALEASLNEIVRRHEILRTTFPLLDGQPVQVIAPVCTLSLSVVDLEALPDSQREAEARRLATGIVQQPFDLATGQLVRASLLRLDSQEHILLIIFHQIVFDGTSSGLFIKEMTALYEAFWAGKSSPLLELPLQYADFAHWQQQRLQDEGLQTQLTYWKGQLGLIQPMRLPTARPRPAEKTENGAIQSFVLPKSLGSALKTLSQQEGSTLFMALLAGLKSLLYGISGQEDLLVFTSAEGRNHPELKPLIGLFTKQLALRTDLTGEPTFRELLGRVRKVTQDAYANQDVPFEKLVDLIELERTNSHSSLFQVMFVFLNDPRPSLDLSGLRLRPWHIGNQMPKFDLRLFIHRTPAVMAHQDELTGWLEYKTDLFDARTITEMLAHFQSLLENIVANPNEPISRLLPPTLNQMVPQLPQKEQDPIERTLVAPRNALEGQLVQIWEQVFGIHPIGVQDNFFALGGHSLLAVRLFEQIEKVTGQKLPLSILLQAPSIEQLADMLGQHFDKLSARQDWGPSWSSLVAVQPRGSKPPLFLVPPVASTALCFATLSRYLGTEQPVYGFDPLGLDGTTPPHERVEDMAAHYIKEMCQLQPDGPYLLGGMCFGGYVALEMAQQLQHQGKPVALLVLLDVAAPVSGPSWTYPKTPKSFIVYRVRRLISHSWDGSLPRRLKNYLKGYLNKWLNYLRPQRRHYQYLLDVHINAQQGYVAKYYSGRVTLFHSDQRAQDNRQKSRWAALAVGGLDYYMIPGTTHASLLVEEFNIELLAKQVKNSLAKLESDGLGMNHS